MDGIPNGSKDGYWKFEWYRYWKFGWNAYCKYGAMDIGSMEEWT
jgi:hypothetical protein